MRVEEVNDRSGAVLATFITSLDELPPGHTFPTNQGDELQLGLFNHSSGHEIKRHYHPLFERNLKFTNEVLVILSGLVQVDIYDDLQELVSTHQLGANSVVILKQGGHGFSIIEHAVIVEVKQGPYAGAEDKILF